MLSSNWKKFSGDKKFEVRFSHAILILNQFWLIKSNETSQAASPDASKPASSKKAEKKRKLDSGRAIELQTSGSESKASSSKSTNAQSAAQTPLQLWDSSVVHTDLSQSASIAQASLVCEVARFRAVQSLSGQF